MSKKYELTSETKEKKVSARKGLRRFIESDFNDNHLEHLQYNAGVL
jgi:hypothetical protein